MTHLLSFQVYTSLYTFIFVHLGILSFVAVLYVFNIIIYPSTNRYYIITIMNNIIYANKYKSILKLSLLQDCGE